MALVADVREFFMKQLKEKWQDVYSPEELQAVQRIEKENLKVLLEVCKKLNITPIMYGGTLIGCVRHKGFVPWDDDVDVAMTRKDYDRFIKEAPALFPKEYVLQNPYSEKKTPYFYSKLRRNGSTYIEYFNYKSKISKGVYIDIYPIDNIPDDELAYRKQFKRTQTWMSLWYLRQSYYLPISTKGWKRFVWKLIRLGLRFIPLFIIRILIYRTMTKYNSMNTQRKSVLHYPKITNWYEPLFPLVDGEFEGICVKLPNDWNNHLQRRYGDYMSMPPADQRLGHKPYMLDVKNFL